ncbi:MAG: CPBP family intramembrane metalloprotease [Planctomycetia bacterium]|nr:CPBP family intramembrane metalloprotease [Planctomycetia bacterium]
MNWSNVKLILMREVRDQLRDRRTLFMIAVLPLLLYPLLGMSFFQVTQFMREYPIRVLVIGSPVSAELPPLVEQDRFAGNLFTDPSTARLLQLSLQPSKAAEAGTPYDPLEQARRDMQQGNYEVVVYFPPNFAAQFARFHNSLLEDKSGESRADAQIPNVDIYPNLAKDASRAAYRRVSEVLDRWREEIGRQNLKDSKVSPAAAKPFEIATLDVAEIGQHKAALWSKVLPFVLLIWALTGAFYPAIDLCAGEKERGTLETLLSSPAERIEIVWGKLLTIMLFSMATAILNLLSLAITGSFVLSQLPNLGPPPGLAIVWLLAALVPVSALFSALCLALAAFARSTKEGQYYLMPLVLVTMPLTILPMAPGVELNLGNSLIPITGVVLLLRAMLEGNYFKVLPYIPLVVAVTLACCWLAIRWATDQFNTESVLFRESERWDINLWIKHLLRDRENTPSVSEAMFCGVLILMIRFFMSFALPMPHTFRDFAVLAVVTQLVVVATPALLMTIMLTRSPAQTLLLRRPPLIAPLAAVLLAVTLHPAINVLQTVVNRVYPLSEQFAKELDRLLIEPDSIWIMVLALGVMPAICEELAFRGFILSGLRHVGHKWTAIILSSVFFGAAHAIFQQSIIACLVGMVIGFLAIQSGSLLPGVLFHVVHNSMGLLIKQVAPTLGQEDHWLHWLMRNASDEGQLYHWPVVLCGLAASIAILLWFQRLPYARTPEESLQEAIDQQSPQWLPS